MSPGEAAFALRWSRTLPLEANDVLQNEAWCMSCCKCWTSAHRLLFQRRRSKSTADRVCSCHTQLRLLMQKTSFSFQWRPRTLCYLLMVLFSISTEGRLLLALPWTVFYPREWVIWVHNLSLAESLNRLYFQSLCLQPLPAYVLVQLFVSAPLCLRMKPPWWLLNTPAPHKPITPVTGFFPVPRPSLAY